MSVMLRILLIVCSIITTMSVIHKIRKAKLRIDDAVFWVCFSIGTIVIAVYPTIIYILSQITGTQSPANLLYLIVIFILIIKIFSMSLHISSIEEKLHSLTAEIALDRYEHEASAKDK